MISKIIKIESSSLCRFVVLDQIKGTLAGCPEWFWSNLPLKFPVLRGTIFCPGREEYIYIYIYGQESGQAGRKVDICEDIIL